MVTVAPLILLVEDEPQMRRFLCATLRANGYQVIEAASARIALAQLAGRNPELILLDLGLPDRDGLEVAREIRRSSSAPVIVISARGREQDKVTALDLGVDDYITKPFGVRELLARMRVALRRVSGPVGQNDVFEVGTLRVDLERRQVTRSGEEVHLTPTEYKLLTALVRHAGGVITHRQLLQDVWGANHANQTHYLRVYMAQLRHKLERDPARPRLLLTEPGVGYRLRDEV